MHQAYLHEIMNAEKFIYIENQFFISSTANPSIDTDGDGQVCGPDCIADQCLKIDCMESMTGAFNHNIGTDIIKNQIAEALACRIEQAIQIRAQYEGNPGDSHQDDGTFRVVIVIPNFPEGAVTDIAVQVSQGASICLTCLVQAVLHYTLMTLSGVPVPGDHASELDERPIGSLISRVKAACGKHLGDESRWIEYITVNCLRNHAVINGIPLMNQIYVHSKLMIVDDRTCICGSANINERSQLGPRDSEVECLI